MKLRPFLFWPHLIAGTVAGGVILIMSLTGVLLTFERQLVAWSNTDFQSHPPGAGAPRRPLDDVLRSFAQWHGSPASSVSIGAEPTEPVVVAAGQRTFYLDAYSGRVLGEGRQGMRQFLSEVRAWHRWLALDGESRATARAITGWSNVVFLFIIASGLYLWFPRRWTWQHLRPIVLFTGGARGKARDFNWHNVIGVWCLVPLFIVVLTAVPISFPWGNDLVYRAMGEQPPAGRRGGAEGREAPRGRGRGGEPRGGRMDARGEHAHGEAATPALGGIDALMTRAVQQEPTWRTITLRLPDSTRAPLPFAIDRGDGGQPQLRSTLTLDRAGTTVSYETFASQSPARRLRSVMRFAHTGEVLGVPGQLVAGIASAGGVVLVWTGIALALRRGRAWLGRRARAAAPVGARPQPAMAASITRVEETRS